MIEKEEFDVPQLDPGRYVHSKSGKEYEVLGVACHSETLEYFVVYKPLYQHSGKPDVWIRPYEMFTEDVEIDGEIIPRFRKL